MKGNLKRAVAGVLASLMLFSSLAIGNAASFPDVDKEDENIVNQVVASKAMVGTDKGFESNKELTRAEAIAIMVRLKGVSEETVKASEGKTNYSDIPSNHWATGYINVATSLGITVGVGNGKFAPDQIVSYAEIATMLVRAIGGGVIAEFDGTWPTNYMNFAMEEGITDGVYKATYSSVNRIETAQMVVNALTAPMWVKSGGSTGGTLDYSKDESKTLLKSALDLTAIENKVLNDVNMSDKKMTVNGKEYSFDSSLSIDVEEGMKVDIWTNKKDEIVWIGKTKDSEQSILEFTSIKSSSIDADEENNDTITLNINGSQKKYNLIDTEARKTEVSINGVTKSLTDLKNAIDTDAKKENTFGKIMLEDNKIQKIFLTQYDEIMVVDKVVDEKIYNDSDVISHSNENLEGKDYIITNQKGELLNVSNLKNGMTLLLAKEGDVYRIMALDNTVEGTITSKSSTGNYIKVDGTKYEVNKFINPQLQDLKSDVKLYLDNNNRIVNCELIEEEVDSSLGIITEAAGIVNTRGDISAEVEITLLDGTVMEVKELDIEKMEENFDNENLFADTSIANINKQLYNGGEASDLLGQMVRFKVSNNKVEIIEFESGFKAFDGSSFTALDKSYSDSKAKLVNIEGYKIDKDTDKLTKAGNTSYRINDNTVVILEKDNDNKAYSTDVEIVDFDSLKTAQDVSMTLAKVDEDTNTVKYMYIRENQNVARETADNYGIILEVASSEDDGVYNLTILSNQGKVELTVDNGTDYDETYVGKLVSYTEKDDEIIGIDVRDTSIAHVNVAKVAKFNEDSIKLSLESNPSATEVLDCADELLFLKADSIEYNDEDERFELGNVTEGSESDITLMATGKNYNTASEDTTSVYLVKIDTDSDGNYDEIGMILYQED